MAKYSLEFQENAVRQLMPPMLRSVAQVSRELRVAETAALLTLSKKARGIWGGEDA